jgi:hypothetical protein
MSAGKGLILLMSLLFALAGYADEVVKFDGDTANASDIGNSMFQYKAGTLTPGQSQTYTKAYSTTSPLLTSGANYTGQNIYGGSYIRLTNGTASNYAVTAAAILLYGGNVTPETIKFQPWVSNLQIGREFGAALMFAVTGAENYGFDASSTLSVKMNLSGSGGGITNRWLVVAGGVSYVSEATINLSAAMSAKTLDNPDEINWAVWTPGADMSFGSLTFNVAGSSIRNITHAGVAASVSLPGGTFNRSYSMEHFSADLAVISGPMTVGFSDSLRLCAIRRNGRGRILNVCRTIIGMRLYDMRVES